MILSPTQISVQKLKRSTSWPPCFVLMTVMLAINTGCASLGNVQERYVACSYDKVWEASLESLKKQPVAIQDKDRGHIETAWVETLVQNRPYGVFQRQGLQEKERVRTRLDLTARNDVTILRASERREHWGFRGGSRIYQWFPVESSDIALNQLLSTITTPLQRQGCLIET